MLVTYTAVKSPLRKVVPTHLNPFLLAFSTVTVALPCVKCPPLQHLLRMKGMCHAFAGTADLVSRDSFLNFASSSLDPSYKQSLGGYWQEVGGEGKSSGDLVACMPSPRASNT